MLIKPPFYFAHCTDSLQGVEPATTTGVNFTAGANNADGAAVEVLSALSHDVHFLVIAISGVFVTTADGKCLLDVLVDPAGGSAWASTIDDLVCGYNPAASTNTPQSVIYYFPIWIPSGSSIGVRARTAHTADITVGRTVMWAYGEPSRPDMWWCGSRVETLGVTAASSAGTTVTPGADGVFGDWTDIGSVTTGRYGAIQFGVNGSDATSANAAYHWQVGYGSNRLPGSPTLWSGMVTTENGARNGHQPIWCDIAEGTQMQIRGTSSLASPENLDLAIYGVH